MKKVTEILNNENVANVFFNLYERWQDEYKYEDINDYGNAVVNTMCKECPNVRLIQSTKKPFGVKVTDGENTYHIFVKVNGNRMGLYCKELIDKKVNKEVNKQLPIIISHDEFLELSEEEKEPYEYAHFIYAHGKLEDDMGIDLLYLSLNGEKLHNGMEAEYNGKKVVFHLFNNGFMDTGIVTYVDDEKAFEYGRKLVNEKPKIF